MGPRIAVSLCGHTARRCVVAREQYLDALPDLFGLALRSRRDALAIADEEYDGGRHAEHSDGRLEPPVKR